MNSHMFTHERAKQQINVALRELEIVQVRKSFLQFGFNCGKKENYVVGFIDIGKAVVNSEAETYAPDPKAYNFNDACEKRRTVKHSGRCAIVYTQKEWLDHFEEKLKNEVKTWKQFY